MAETVLGSGDMRAFCQNVAIMLSVGIQTEEAVHMLAESSESTKLESACMQVYSMLKEGNRLSASMAEAHCFPKYAIDTIAAGERTGHVEETLTSLAVYYDEEDRLFSKVRSSVTYPAVLLCIMSIILAFTVAAILPVFMDVYDSMAGGISASSFDMVDAGVIIGWVSLGITLVVTLIALIAMLMSRSTSGRNGLLRACEKLPGAKGAFEALALSRFTSTLAVYTASGANSDDAMKSAMENVEHKGLMLKARAVYASMIEPIRPKSLIQAIADYNLYDPLHVRTLRFSMRAGRLDEALDSLSEDLLEESIDGIDRLIDKVEPLLAGFVTVAVGLTLIAVMLPLIGIMGSIG